MTDPLNTQPQADYYHVDPPPAARAFERHIQTVLAGLLIGLVAWVGITVTGNREHISRLDERLKFQGVTLGEIKEELKDRAVPVMEIPHLQEQVRKLKAEGADLEESYRALSSRVTRLEDERRPP